jgi:hypothetical protein
MVRSLESWRAQLTLSKINALTILVYTSTAKLCLPIEVGSSEEK